MRDEEGQVAGGREHDPEYVSSNIEPCQLAAVDRDDSQNGAAVALGLGLSGHGDAAVRRNGDCRESVRSSQSGKDRELGVRGLDLDRDNSEGILHHLSPDEFFLLPNTAGCYTAEDALRYARLARAAGFNEWLKLEVIGDEKTLLPDTTATLEATRVLVDEGFKVMAYTNDDLIMALRLEDAGCVAVMPLASPIGSGLGIVNPYYIREIKDRLDVPVIVDAGVGTASDACVTMEQGVDAVLMNTAIAAADDPVAMGAAMRHAILAGRMAYLAGRMPSREIAVPSSPSNGMLG